MGSTGEKLDKLHYEALPSSANKAVGILANAEWLKKSKWYLAGGTALAFQAGHRRSVDLDFFSFVDDFSTDKLIKRFPKSDFKVTSVREGTLYGQLLDTKISFIAYPFFKPSEPYKWYGCIRMLDPKDIAVMKIVAISQRGRKRDFVDLYWYVLSREPLIEVLQKLPAQYPTVAHDYQHILKSLMYFADAEPDPMPKIFFNASWPDIKKYFRKEVPEVTKRLLKIK